MVVRGKVASHEIYGIEPLLGVAGKERDRVNRPNAFNASRAPPASSSSAAMVTFRDSSVVILDTSRDSVKAVLGLGDLLHVPSIVCLVDITPRNIPTRFIGNPSARRSAART